MKKKELIDLVQEIKILRLTSNDILVIKIPEYISSETHEEIRAVFSTILKELDLSTPHLVVTSIDLTMEVVRKE
jgi:hypothetical protein